MTLEADGKTTTKNFNFDVTIPSIKTTKIGYTDGLKENYQIIDGGNMVNIDMPIKTVCILSIFFI